jgi:phosphohistidine phosphatase SixA
MRPDSGSFEPHDEVDEIRWVPATASGTELSYERAAEVLRAVPPPLLVVRHGSAGDRDEWDADDARRPLDEQGRRQAEALVDQLAGFEIDRIVSSPFDRCVQTVEPLARVRKLELEVSEDLAEEVGPERVGALLLNLAGEAAVVCGHGPELFPLLGKTKKGATVVVEAAGDGLNEIGRLPPG